MYSTLYKVVLKIQDKYSQTYLKDTRYRNL